MAALSCHIGQPCVVIISDVLSSVEEVVGKANELLQKENLLLNNKVQDLSGGQQPDGVSAGKVESLTETIDRQFKELEALRRAVEQERARADRMTELAELGPESADGANDAWSTQF